MLKFMSQFFWSAPPESEPEEDINVTAVTRKVPKEDSTETMVLQIEAAIRKSDVALFKKLVQDDTTILEAVSLLKPKPLTKGEWNAFSSRMKHEPIFEPVVQYLGAKRTYNSKTYQLSQARNSERRTSLQKEIDEAQAILSRGVPPLGMPDWEAVNPSDALDESNGASVLSTGM